MSKFDLTVYGIYSFATIDDAVLSINFFYGLVVR